MAGEYKRGDWVKANDNDDAVLLDSFTDADGGQKENAIVFDASTGASTRQALAYREPPYDEGGAGATWRNA